MRAITILLLSAICCLLPVELNAAGTVHVRGYTRKDGTYVAPHYRSAPDGNFYNNWSTKGNINPYTGKEGTKVTPPAGYGGSSYIPSTPRFDDTSEALNVTPRASPAPVITTPSVRPSVDEKNRQRAEFWKERGYDFNPSIMSAYAMDQKVKNLDRARYWKEQGYNFNADFMTAYSMDQKVKDIQRANYWKQQGHNFNPDFMTAYSMDRKVKDIERAKYWKERGFNFNSDYMTAYSMDREAEKMLKQGAAQKIAPRVVNVEGIGSLQFPGDASDAEILEFINKEFPRLQKEISERSKAQK